MSISKPRRSRDRHRGFTLIELLVVLTLMGSLLALVAPLGAESVERFAAQRELRGIQALLKAASARAFTYGAPVLLEFEGRELQVRQLTGDGSELLELRRFEHLRFAPGQLAFSRAGFPSAPALPLTYRGAARSVDLSALLAGRREAVQ